ncbi:MAG: AMIN domain-containing protein [Leptolyngbyaceae cyanobacterium bins.349]|nr:AMIN domain-containing protein [Leptolyngbyaceae cyanobacterium bins.349]
MQHQSSIATFLFKLMSLLSDRRCHSQPRCNGLGVLALTAIAVLSQAASVFALSSWRYDPTANQLEITVKAGTMPKYFVMAQPARIVLDLPDTEMGDVKVKESFEGAAIRQVRVSQFQPGMTRIVLELAPDVALAPGQVKLETVKGAAGDRWVLHPLIASPAVTAARPAKVESPAVGSDVSPVTMEPPVSTVSVPPLPSSVASAPVKTPAPAPAIAQLPADSTTPLPPDAALPPADLVIESNNAVPITVPPPASVPPVSIPPVSGPPVSIPPVSLPSSVPVMPASTVGRSGVGVASPRPLAPASIQPLSPEPVSLPNLEIPSTARSLPVNAAPQVVVPTLSPNPTAPMALPVLPAMPAPAPIAVPPLNPVPIPVAPLPSPTTGRITQVSGGQPISTTIIQPSMPNSPASTAPAASPGVTRQPPASWVMQSSGLPQPTLPGAVPASSLPTSSFPAIPPTPTAPTASPALTRVTAPPASWVMQNSGLPQPSLTQTMQPPVSSVMQPSGSVQAPGLVPPVAPAPVALPLPVSSVMQSPGMPSSGGAIAPMPSARMQSPTPMPPLPAPALPATATPTVSVPPVQPVMPSGSAMPAVSVPPLQPGGVAAPLPAPVAPESVIEFGQPLPLGTATALNTQPLAIAPAPMSASATGALPVGSRQPMFVQSANPAIALPAGTSLILSYPGTLPMQPDATAPRQDMMVLQTEVRDAAGTVIFPQGTYVLGQFETTQAGTKFVTSAIQRGDRIIPLAAESDPISGNREISPSSMAIFSGAGALAGGLISGFSGWGLLLGGAAGAATNYLTAPKPASIQPGQVVQVRVLRDLPY